MQIPLQAQFMNLEGKPLTSNNVPFLEGEELGEAKVRAEAASQKFVNGIPLTMRDVLIVAITTEFPDDQKDHAKIVDEKIKRFGIYQDIAATKKEDASINISTETATYFKSRIARCFSMLVAGPALKILDGVPKAANEEVSKGPDKK